MRQRVGIIAGSFNPPTRAHLALARAGLAEVDRVVWAIPRQFPHKTFDGATLDERVAMLEAIASEEPGFEVEVSSGGLFIDIARECRARRDDADIWLLCGRDAAERIVDWDYGDPRVVDEMFEEFGLLVAPRGGIYVPPQRFAHRVRPLGLEGCEQVSSTEVRQRVKTGQEWRHLVPEPVIPLIERIYR